MGDIATLQLNKIFINLVATGAAVSAASNNRGSKVASQGAVTSNAGGRRRSITGPGVSGSFTFTLLLVPDADRQTLIGWQRQTVLFRDNRGQKAYGVFYGVDSVEYRSILGKYELTITLNVVDVVEGV